MKKGQISRKVPGGPDSPESAPHGRGPRTGGAQGFRTVRLPGASAHMCSCPLTNKLVHLQCTISEPRPLPNLCQCCRHLSLSYQHPPKDSAREVTAHIVRPILACHWRLCPLGRVTRGFNADLWCRRHHCKPSVPLTKKPRYWLPPCWDEPR